MTSIVLLLLAIIISNANVHHHCVHNKLNLNIYQTNVDYDDQLPHRRLHTVFTDSLEYKDESPLHQPIRIHTHYDVEKYFDTDSYPASEIRIRRIMDAAILYLKNTIYVKPVSSSKPLRVPAPNSDSTCGEIIDIPKDHQTSGVSSADLIIYVSFGNYKYQGNPLCSAMTRAFAGTCRVDQIGRPFAGFINFCAAILDPEHNFISAVNTAIHELLHILVMNDLLWNKFIDEHNNTIDIKNVLKTSPNRSIITTKAKQFIQSHFLCDSSDIDGIPLTDDAHFDEILFNFHMMNPIRRIPIASFSGLMGAFLEDSGHYKVNFLFVDMYYSWGKGQGCDFIKRCNESSSTQFWCRNKDDRGCAYDYSAPAQCVIDEFDASTANTLLVSDSNIHNHDLVCPFRVPDLSENIPFQQNCWDKRGNKHNPQVNMVSFQQIVYYGIDSRCIQTEYKGLHTHKIGFCMRIECLEYDQTSNEYSTIRIYPFKSKPDAYNCTLPDALYKTHEFEYDMGVKYAANTVTIVCPNINTICNGRKPFECYWGQYNPEINKCICYPGYVGVYCEDEYNEQSRVIEESRLRYLRQTFIDYDKYLLLINNKKDNYLIQRITAFDDNLLPATEQTHHDEIKMLLEEINLTRYYDLFIRNGFNTIGSLKDEKVETLKTMGIETSVDARKIRNQVLKKTILLKLR